MSAKCQLEVVGRADRTSSGQVEIEASEWPFPNSVSTAAAAFGESFRCAISAMIECPSLGPGRTLDHCGNRAAEALAERRSGDRDAVGKGPFARLDLDLARRCAVGAPDDLQLALRRHSDRERGLQARTR